MNLLKMFCVLSALQLCSATAYAVDGETPAFSADMRQGSTSAREMKRKLWDYPGNGELYHANESGQIKPHALCEELKSYMNSTKPRWKKEGGRTLNDCAQSGRTAPFLTEPPWTELDPHVHVTLVAKLMRFSAEGAPSYFNISPMSSRRTDANYRNDAEEFIRQGGRLQLWRTRLLGLLQDPRTLDHRPAPAGEHNVVQLRYGLGTTSEKAGARQCPLPDWEGRTFLVTDGLDELVRHYGLNLSRSTLMLYRGLPVMYPLSEHPTLSIDGAAGGPNSPHCELVSQVPSMKKGKK